MSAAPAAQRRPRAIHIHLQSRRRLRDSTPPSPPRLAVDGNRDLTAFDLGTKLRGRHVQLRTRTVRAVTVTRDVIRTESCNTCHYQLAFHGGYASGMPMCVMCHQPQNADPATGNTLDLKVFAHKLHMGSQLPSVLGYTSGTTKVPPAPYEIIGYMNSVNNFSTVIDPAMPQPLRGLPQPDHRRRASQSLPDRTHRAPPAAPATTMSISPPASTTPAVFQDGRHRVRQLPHPAR